MVNRTVRGVYREATDMLKDAGIENASYEAAEIVASVCNKTREFVLTHAEAMLAEHRLRWIDRDIKRRIAGEPLQYVLGQWEFYSELIHTGKGVLVPRQDTELLVDCVLEGIADKENPQLLDLCSGSGCIAVAVVKNHKTADVTAVEYYDEAMDYLERNIDYHRVPAHIHARKYDVLTAPDGSFGKYDVIVANPPYIQTDKLADLQIEVKSEPVTALDGGADGCDFYRSIADNWACLLNDGGFIAVEIGYDIADDVCKIFGGAGFDTEIKKDLCGNDRVVIARKK